MKVWQKRNEKFRIFITKTTSMKCGMLYARMHREAKRWANARKYTADGATATSTNDSHGHDHDLGAKIFAQQNYIYVIAKTIDFWMACHRQRCVATPMRSSACVFSVLFAVRLRYTWMSKHNWADNGEGRKKKTQNFCQKRFFGINYLHRCHCRWQAAASMKIDMWAVDHMEHVRTSLNTRTRLCNGAARAPWT